MNDKDRNDEVTTRPKVKNFIYMVGKEKDNRMYGTKNHEVKKEGQPTT
jgi:hypothetical protein